MQFKDIINHEIFLLKFTTKIIKKYRILITNYVSQKILLLTSDVHKRFV